MPPTSTTFTFCHRFEIAGYRLRSVPVLAVFHLTVSPASVSPITDRHAGQGASEWRVLIVILGMRMPSVSLSPSRKSCDSLFRFCGVISNSQRAQCSHYPPGQQHSCSEDLCASPRHGARSRATPEPQQDEVDPTVRRIPALRNEPGAVPPPPRPRCPRACSSSLRLQRRGRTDEFDRNGLGGSLRYCSRGGLSHERWHTLRVRH